MNYDVKLTVAKIPVATARWKGDIQAESPEEATRIAVRQWRAEWKDNLPATEMRIYVYEHETDKPIWDGRAFRWDIGSPPKPLRAE